MIKLIEQYREGARVFRCDCKHDFIIPKNKVEVKCPYCGAIEVKTSKQLPIV